MVQVYHEKVYDLLNNRQRVSAREGPSGHVILHGLIEVRWLKTVEHAASPTLSPARASLFAIPAVQKPAAAALLACGSASL